MEIFTGIDIIELERFKSLNYFNRVAEFILTARELKLMGQSRDRCQYLASRFAAKEAVIKALPLPATLADLEIITISLKPSVFPLLLALKRYKISLSLSHSKVFVAASAVVLLN